MTKFDKGMKNMWWFYFYIYICFLFGLSYLEISLYKNTSQCHLFPWVEFISSSAEMLYKCDTLTDVLEQLSESLEKVTKYKPIEAFRPSYFLILFVAIDDRLSIQLDAEELFQTQCFSP